MHGSRVVRSDWRLTSLRTLTELVVNIQRISATRPGRVRENSIDRRFAATYRLDHARDPLI